ncbi:MAG TPA: 5-formyltetrahydrofolate cyclo-ligase [Cyanobacteria bacterium UBA11372]|nr:5-formyltetrahydrofolate cyclo-ligase [Cyanobacteria bacterium UBA11372]
MDKVQLRSKLLKTRRAMSVEEWREKSSRIASHLLSSLLFTQAKTILAYSSFRQEPDLSSLFAEPKQWGLPRVEGKSLVWHRWKAGELLLTGAYGIFEPDANSPILEAEEVDLILVPAVACDRLGYRLGYGGGYYDRLLSSPEWSSKFTIGIVFDFACLPELPVDEWDRRLNGVCTETGLIITK